MLGAPWAPAPLHNPGAGGLGGFGGSPPSVRSANQQAKASLSTWGACGEAGLWGGTGEPCHALQPTPSPGSESLSPVFLGWGFRSHQRQPWAPKPCPRHQLAVHTQANIPTCSGPGWEDEDLALGSLWRFRKCAPCGPVHPTHAVTEGPARSPGPW